MAHTHAYSDPGYNELTANLVTILSLSVGQQVWIDAGGIDEMNSVDGNGMWSWFSGYLLYAL